ncbi:hypothetical protein AAG906_022280 [Vitis piasezkii]
MDILKKFKLESCKEVATHWHKMRKFQRMMVRNLRNPLHIEAWFMSSPSNVHMGVAKRVLKYVKGTTNLGICIDDMKSTLGYVFTIGSVGTINYSEYISLAANQAIWLRKLLVDLGQEQSSPTELSVTRMHYCSTDEQLVDIMTKGLPKSRLEFLRLKLGMSKANLKEEC